MKVHYRVEFIYYAYHCWLITTNVVFSSNKLAAHPTGEYQWISITLILDNPQFLLLHYPLFRL